jgi:hypothetical protein
MTKEEYQATSSQIEKAKEALGEAVQNLELMEAGDA